MTYKNELMKAWLLNKISDLEMEDRPLHLEKVARPIPGEYEILIRISACGVCHTEIDEIEGRTPPPVYPVIPGHQVIGVVEECGINTSIFKMKERVGVAWIYAACGDCEFCRRGDENLCENFKATGRDANGGYAEFMTVHEKFAFRIPPIFSDAEAAPLLCAGAIGYRSLKLSGIAQGQVLGLSGFGASGHLVLKMAQHLFPGSTVFVFARNKEEQLFARSLGASWSGKFSDTPPEKINAIIDTTPAWQPVLNSLANLKPGGRLVINAIRKDPADKSVLSEIHYREHLWLEKEIKSVANITRQDVEEFLALAAKIPIRPEVQIYSFEDANKALTDLKRKHIKGAKVLSLQETVSFFLK